MYKYIKRILDVIISASALIILLPLYIIIMILIKITTRDKIFYNQIRTGKNGKNFKMYKFRTMKNKKVTKIGKMLRNTSLDELPQFLNVLKGDMSIIGPRPWIPEYYKRFNRHQKKRTKVLPGIIGLAQVNGRNNIDIFQKINYDIEYVNNISLILDIKILLKSVKVIFIKEDINTIEQHLNYELEQLEKNKKRIEKTTMI
jgi:lipopolysaccharide/colanic/teichoic acid biosynthesis glycosyltransferase